jgi:ABC-2 type transport system ATP-binding protein
MTMDHDPATPSPDAEPPVVPSPAVAQPAVAPQAPAPTPPPPPAAPPAAPSPDRPTPALEVEHVSRWYGNVVAVNDISFALGPGVTGLLGPNGAGKSTLLHLMAGLLAPSAGNVRVMGKNAWRRPAMYHDIGLVPEREAVQTYLTGRQFARLNAVLQGMREPDAAAARAIAAVDLTAAADRPIGTYSKGMRQRAKLAGALVHEPAVLLLDEPFNGLDPRQRLHMIALLRSMAAEGRTILFSSHILEEVERVADSILVVYAGRLAAAGDFRSIRRLMTDRPSTFTVRSSDDRRLAAALMTDESVFGAELAAGQLAVRTAAYEAFTRSIARIAKASGVTLYEVAPTDDSLESVFSYLVRR